MGEITTIILNNDKIRIEHIVSNGVNSPEGFYFDQDEDEVVTVMKGDAVLEINSEQINLSTMDSYYIHAHIKHRVHYTSADCEWLCMFIKNI